MFRGDCSVEPDESVDLHKIGVFRHHRNQGRNEGRFEDKRVTDFLEVLLMGLRDK